MCAEQIAEPAAPAGEYQHLRGAAVIAAAGIVGADDMFYSRETGVDWSARSVSSVSTRHRCRNSASRPTRFTAGGMPSVWAERAAVRQSGRLAKNRRPSRAHEH